MSRRVTIDLANVFFYPPSYRYTSCTRPLSIALVYLPSEEITIPPTSLPLLTRRLRKPNRNKTTTRMYKTPKSRWATTRTSVRTLKKKIKKRLLRYTMRYIRVPTTIRQINVTFFADTNVYWYCISYGTSTYVTLVLPFRITWYF